MSGQTFSVGKVQGLEYHLAGVPKPGDMGFNTLRKSRTPIPFDVWRKFPDYRQLIASIGYFAAEGHPTDLYFTLVASLVPDRTRHFSYVPNSPFYSLDGVLTRDDSRPGGGHRQIILAAQSLLRDDEMMVKVLANYIFTGQVQRDMEILKL